MSKTHAVQPDEIIEVLDRAVAEADILRQAYRTYDTLTDDDLQALDRYAAPLAAMLRMLADEAVADAVAHDLLPANASDYLERFQHIDVGRFAFECREAAASCEAYGLYDPVEAVEKARQAGLRWMAAAGARVLAADPKYNSASLLIRAARQAEHDAAEARLERLEAERKENKRNLSRQQEARARRDEAVRIMQGADVSPAKFIAARSPGWQELANLYGVEPGRSISDAASRMMRRDWQDIQVDSLLAR